MKRAYARDPDKFKRRSASYDARKKAEDPEGYLEAERERQRDWARRNPEKAREGYRRRGVTRRATPQGKLADNLRCRINAAIDGRSRNNMSAVRHLGCTLDELKTHLEKQFLPGMTWDNHTLDGWHVDHIKPLAKFDLTDPEQFKAACHFTNLQPLWAPDNQSKGSSDPPSATALPTTAH